MWKVIKYLKKVFQNKYAKHDAIVKKIAKQLNSNPKKVDNVIKVTLSILADMIRDGKDYRPIKVTYWGKFVPIAGRKKKE